MGLGEGGQGFADDPSSSFFIFVNVMTIMTIMETTLIMSVAIMMLFCWFQGERHQREWKLEIAGIIFVFDQTR